MKPNNLLLFLGGVLCLITAFIHLFMGQTDLIDPLMNSDLSGQVKAELLGVWHMVTIILFTSAISLLYNGWRVRSDMKLFFMRMGYLYASFGTVFIIVSMSYNLLAPQWILLIPIGLLAYLGAMRISL